MCAASHISSRISPRPALLYRFLAFLEEGGAVEFLSAPKARKLKLKPESFICSDLCMYLYILHLNSALNRNPQLHLRLKASCPAAP